MSKITAKINGITTYIYSIEGNGYPTGTESRDRAMDYTLKNIRQLSERYPHIKFMKAVVK